MKQITQRSVVKQNHTKTMILKFCRKTSQISSSLTSNSPILHSNPKTHLKSSLNPLISQNPISNSSISIESHLENVLKSPYSQLPNNKNNSICSTKVGSLGFGKHWMYATLPSSNIPTSENHQDPFFITQNDVRSALLSLKNQPLPAFKYFKWVEKQNQPCFDVGFESFCVLLHILVGHSSKNWKLVRELGSFQKYIDDNNNANIVIQGLIESSKKFDLLLNAQVLNCLIEYFVVNDRLDDAIACYIAMIDNCGTNLGAKCGVVLLKKLIRKNRFKDVDELLDKMYSRGETRDVRIIRGVMRACFDVRKFEEGEGLFMKARDMGFRLDAKTYRCAIEVVCKNPNSNAAFDLLKEMKEKGWMPCVSTFIYIVSVCVKQGKMVEALRAAEEMISYGLSMNLVVATKLVKGYCELGDLESGSSLVAKVVKEGVYPNRLVFSLLIRGYCSKGEMEEACTLYELMMGMGIKTGFYMIVSLIKGLLEARLWDKACEHLQMAVESGIIKYSSYTFLLSWLCAEGKVDEVQQLWNRMVETETMSTITREKLSRSKEKTIVGNGFRPDAITYTILMEGYFKKGEVEKALKVFDEMARQRIARSAHTYNTIIRGLCYNGQTSQARKMLQKFAEEGFELSFTTYSYILSGFIKEDDLNSALFVCDEMSRKGLIRDVRLSETNVDELRGNNELDSALESLKRMVDESLEREVMSYETLIYSACQRNKLNTAVNICSGMLHKGLPLHKRILDCIIKTYEVGEKL